MGGMRAAVRPRRFIEAADSAWLFDNSGVEPELVGRMDEGVLRWNEEVPVELFARMTNRS